jgi:hypothetical protein
MKRLAIALTLVTAGGAGCASGSGGRAMLLSGPLEVRAAQSRVFDTGDARLVLKAALNALQDAGFVIRQTDADLGLVTAVAEWKSRSQSTGLKVFKWAAAPFTYGASLLIPAGRTEFASVEANVNVTREGGRTRARVSLVSRVTDAEGKVRRVETIADPLAYQSLLARLDKAVYLEREGL